MNALVAPPFPPFPTNPTVGQQFMGWAWNGCRWVQSAPAASPGIIVTVFTASGLYMPSPGLTAVTVECIGGGGPGGNAGSPGTTYALGGGGGGSGGYSRKTLPAALVAGGVQVTVGVGGVGASGNQGGDTSFGALCIAHGGFAGGSNDAAGALYGGYGPGAPAGVGDVAMPGSAGQNGPFFVETTGLIAANFAGGMGGWIYGGTSSVDVSPNSAAAGANAMPNTGAGGGGACVNQVGATPAVTPVQYGGAGGSGVCTVTEYIFGLFGMDGDCGAPVPCPPDPCWPGPVGRGCP